MKTLLLACALLMLAPAAEAASEIKVQLEDHPAEHKFKVPLDSHRTTVPLKVSLVGQEFVCVTEAKWSVDAIITYDQPWAGVSLDPKVSQVTFAQGTPGANPVNRAGNDMSIDVFWDSESRPKTNAQITYKIEVPPANVKSVGEGAGGPCMPPPTIIGDEVKITFYADDIVENLDPSAIDCNLMPDDPACLAPIETTAPAESPGVGVLMMAGALFAVAYLRRRQN